jgi:hypothetical protein
LSTRNIRPLLPASTLLLLLLLLQLLLLLLLQLLLLLLRVCYAGERLRQPAFLLLSGVQHCHPLHAGWDWQAAQ